MKHIKHSGAGSSVP